MKKLQDISRMKKHLRYRMEHVLDAESAMEPDQYFKSQDWYISSSYARYGKATGLDPGKLFPDKEEIAKIIAEEKQFEPTLQERWDKLAEEKESADSFTREKEE